MATSSAAVRSLWPYMPRLPLCRGIVCRQQLWSRGLRRSGSERLARRALRFPAARMQDEFGVAVGLLASPEDEVAGGREGNAAKVRGHRLVMGIACILPVHHGSHPLERCHHLVAGSDAVMQPVREMLTGDAQSRTV